MTNKHSENSGRRIKVAICVPSTGTWDVDFGRSLVGLFHYTHLWRPEEKDNISSLQISLLTQNTSMLVKNRHDLVVAALRDDCTHVLFLDADMVYPPDTLVRLLRWNKAFVGVNATTRMYPVEHIAHDLKGHRVDSRKKHGLQAVQHVGLAVALIDLAMVKEMNPPLFMMEWIPETNAYCGEDVYFCAKVQEVGETVYIDHTLSHEVLHVGKMRFGPGMIGLEKPDPKVGET